MVSKGFTLIELLAVVAITVILSSLLLANTREPSRKLELRRGAQTLAADLRRVQGLATAPQRTTCGAAVVVPSYGLRLQALAGETAGYILFADCDRNNVFDAVGSNDFIVASTTIELVAVSSTTPASGGVVWLEVVFIPPSPDVAINGLTFPYPTVGDFGIQLCHLADSLLCTSVWGNTRGNIEVE